MIALATQLESQTVLRTNWLVSKECFGFEPFEVTVFQIGTSIVFYGNVITN